MIWRLVMAEQYHGGHGMHGAAADAKGWYHFNNYWIKTLSSIIIIRKNIRLRRVSNQC